MSKIYLGINERCNLSHSANLFDNCYEDELADHRPLAKEIISGDVDCSEVIGASAYLIDSPGALVPFHRKIFIRRNENVAGDGI